MSEPAAPHPADALYEPLEGPASWAAVSGDGGWAEATAAWRGWQEADRPRAAMALRGALLAAAHESAALDGLFPGDTGLVRSLLSGVVSLEAVGEARRAHVRAGYDALVLQLETHSAQAVSEAWIRRIHHVACRPQLTHRVREESGTQDHVLATGDYKHHPNHTEKPGGGWRAHVPVPDVRGEMRRLVGILGGEAFAAMGPAARAAYVHHGLSHVAPFADGNGRVARVLAAAHFGADNGDGDGLPLLVRSKDASAYGEAMAAAEAGEPAALVHFVGQRGRDLVAVLEDLHRRVAVIPDQARALDRWRERDQAADLLADVLRVAMDAALARHRARTDLGWLARLDDAAVTRPHSRRVKVVVDLVEGAEVGEVVEVDAHPLLDDGALDLRAEEARLRLQVPPGAVLAATGPALGAHLGPWLDRVVSTLALRVAAELE